jgi:hypothetical protein
MSRRVVAEMMYARFFMMLEWEVSVEDQEADHERHDGKLRNRRHSARRTAKGRRGMALFTGER